MEDIDAQFQVRPSEPVRILRRADLQVRGLSRRTIEREVREGRLEPIRKGVYVVAADAAGVAEGVSEAVDEERRWRRQMALNLARGGSGSALSHRCAAFLHRFDGFVDLSVAQRSDDISVPLRSSFRGPPAIRATQLGPEDIIELAEFAVTSAGRTLADLGRFVSLDDLELAVESALRIDPARPDEWREHLLRELQQRAEVDGRGRTGLAALRVVLARRPPGARPTGSPAETRAVQALRPVGLDWLTRQPTIRLLTPRGAVLRWAYPDLADLDRLFFVEIDGFGTHGTKSALDRDLRRQNELSDIFRIVRFSASRVSTAPGRVADEVLARWQRAPLEPRNAWTTDDFHVRRTADGLDVTVPNGYR